MLALLPSCSGRPPSPPRAWLTLAVLAVLMLVACRHPGASRERDPYDLAARAGQLNIILISMDALRFDRTGLGDEPTPWTPHLDRFAREAAVFHAAVSPSSWTVPSHLSVWTGRWPSHHGMVNKLRPDPTSKELIDSALAKEVPTYPERLAAAGWTAAAFTGGAGVSARFGFGRGFQRYLDDKRFAGLEYSAPPALEWLRANRDRRFFLFLHGYDAHGQHPLDGMSPRQADPAYRGKLDGSLEEQARLRELGLTSTRVIGQPASLRGVIDERDGRFLRAIYDRKVQAADQRLGAFLDGVRALGLWDRSIIVLMSDHGDEFMEHGHIDHGHTLYEEQLHVPLLLRFPGDTARRDLRATVSTIDLFPTLFDALGLPPLPQVDGQSLLPLLRGQAQPERLLFAETDYRLFVHHRMVRSGRHKLVVDLRGGGQQLFDLTTDPGELRDLRAKDVALRDRLDAALNSWLAAQRTPRGALQGVSETPIKIF